MMKSKKNSRERNNNAFYALVEKLFFDSFSLIASTLNSLNFI